MHESCYGVLDADFDADSEGSGNTTEPWFCEPCMSGLQYPPYCELCPMRGGAMKRTGNFCSKRAEHGRDGMIPEYLVEGRRRLYILEGYVQ